MTRATFLPLLALALAMSGCGARDRDTAASARAAARARTDEVIVALQADGLSLDPHAVTDAGSMRLIENLYSTLLRYAEVYGDFEPDLAESWDVDADGLRYTFQLRTNAVFHGSGAAVTAEDAVYSIDRIRELGVRADQFEPVTEVRAEDPHTLVIELAEPFAPLLSYLAHPMNAIVDRRAVEEQGLERAGGGSGPFRLEEWRRDRHLILSRHEDYHLADRPRVERVVFRPIPDDTARITALRNGEIDIILDVAARDVERLERIPGVTVDSVPGTFWEYVGLNNAHPPFDDVRVRQAIAWAVDRDVLNRLVKFGRAKPLRGGPIPPNHWARHDVEIYPARDLEQARALLEEAGLADGFEAGLLVGSDFSYQVQAAEVVKQQLLEIGIDVTIRALESGMFFQRLGQREFQMSLVGWLGFVDPDEWTHNLFRTEAPWNQQAYSNPEVDAWLAEGRRKLEREERKPIYDRIQETVAREAPMVFLYINDRTAARLDTVHGFVAHPTLTTLSLRDVWLDR